MKYRIVFLFLLSSLMTYAAQKHSSKGNVSPLILVEWNSEESISRLSRSSHKTDFFPLSNHFVSQENKIFCGLASSVIVLNAFRLRQKESLPQDKKSIEKSERKWLPTEFNPFFGKYTPNNILNNQTKKKIEVLGKPIQINGKMKKDYGLQLRQLAQVLRANQLNVTIRVVNEAMDAKVIKQEIIKNLTNQNDFVLVNYDRKSLGQKGGGHISPLGAYDQDSDSFLIMDVNPNKAPWVWVKSKDLIEAMRTFDTVENRGYLLISEIKHQNSPLEKY